MQHRSGVSRGWIQRPNAVDATTECSGCDGRMQWNRSPNAVESFAECSGCDRPIQGCNRRFHRMRRPHAVDAMAQSRAATGESTGCDRRFVGCNRGIHRMRRPSSPGSALHPGFRPPVYRTRLLATGVGSLLGILHPFFARFCPRTPTEAHALEAGRRACEAPDEISSTAPRRRRPFLLLPGGLAVRISPSRCGLPGHLPRPRHSLLSTITQNSPLSIT